MCVCVCGYTSACRGPTSGVDGKKTVAEKRKKKKLQQKHFLSVDNDCVRALEVFGLTSSSPEDAEAAPG